MNTITIREIIDKALARQTTFLELLATLSKEGVESYHVDFLRNGYRFYATNGESFVTGVDLLHDPVTPEFSADKLEQINQRVQSGKAWYPDFVREGAAAGCAYYIVFLRGKKVRYFGRDGGEYVQHFPASRPSAPEPGKQTMTIRIARSTTKSVDIEAAPEKVFSFLSDPINWPRYAVVNLRSVSPGQNGWFEAVTKFGEGQIKVDGVKELGVFDHIWKDPQATWRVYSRVVPNGEGSTVMMTLFQPPVMTDQQFDHAMKEMDIEMNKLKEILQP